MTSAALLDILLVAGLLLMFVGGLADIDSSRPLPRPTVRRTVRQTVRRTVRRFVQRRTCDGHSTDTSTDTDTKSDCPTDSPTDCPPDRPSESPPLCPTYVRLILSDGHATDNRRTFDGHGHKFGRYFYVRRTVPPLEHRIMS